MMKFRLAQIPKYGAPKYGAPKHGLNMHSFFKETLPNAISLNQLKNAPLAYGNKTIRVADMFAISGRLGSDIEFNVGKSGSYINYLGAWLSEKYNLVINGDVGDYAGFNLNGGTINLNGNANHYAAAQMAKGNLTINGNAGDWLASAIATEATEGMSGGVVLIKGNVGNNSGFRMRRGTVIVKGKCGENLANFMKGGTIIVKGKTANNVGRFIKRGSLFLLGNNLLRKKTPSSTTSSMWQDCGMSQLAFFGLLQNSLPPRSCNIPQSLRRFTHNKAELFTK